MLLIINIYLLHIFISFIDTFDNPSKIRDITFLLFIVPCFLDRSCKLYEIIFIISFFNLNFQKLKVILKICRKWKHKNYFLDQAWSPETFTCIWLTKLAQQTAIFLFPCFCVYTLSFSFTFLSLFPLSSSWASFLPPLSRNTTGIFIIFNCSVHYPMQIKIIRRLGSAFIFHSAISFFFEFSLLPLTDIAIWHAKMPKKGKDCFQVFWNRNRPVNLRMNNVENFVKHFRETFLYKLWWDNVRIKLKGSVSYLV